MAREVLAIPVSTVASECAFSTGGRVVSPYRNCLAPKTVGALICTQDWLKGTSLSKLFDEDCKEIENFEQGRFYVNHLLFYIFYFMWRCLFFPFSFL